MCNNLIEMNNSFYPYLVAPQEKKNEFRFYIPIPLRLIPNPLTIIGGAKDIQPNPVNLHIAGKVTKRGALSKYGSFSWTKEQDERLKGLVQKYGVAKWDVIRNRFPQRSKGDLIRRFRLIAKNIRKTVFTSEEDRIISQGVQKYGQSCKWNEIAQLINESLPGETIRVGEQCRDHWRKVIMPKLIRENQKQSTEQEAVEAEVIEYYE